MPSAEPEARTESASSPRGRGGSGGSGLRARRGAPSGRGPAVASSLPGGAMRAWRRSSSALRMLPSWWTTWRA
eukprot:14169346-Alexandrium_andersonii.AAC.1